MARRSDLIPLLNINGEHMRYISVKEACGLMESGAVEDVSGWRARKDHKIKAVKLVTSRNDNSPCTISSHESDLNANCRGNQRDAYTPAEKAAVSKIEMWPYVHDTKAVYVSPKV